MSKLFKSKFLLGVLVVAAVLVGVSAVNAKSASADCTITMTLRVGSVGAEVMCLQGKVGAVADGKFGPKTLLAVKTWQAAHGLAADGVVGPMTRAALNGAVSGNFPAGCTSAAGYSPTTGVKCDSAPSTGLPAGCTSTAGYSSTTGMKCDGSSTGSNNNGPLSGGAGNVDNYELLSSPANNREVGEDQEDVKVLGFSVEPEGSDLEVTAVKLVFNEGNAASDFEDYASEVSVWYGSKEVARVDADEFTDDNDWTKTLSLDNAIVREGDVGKFYVAVSGVANLDTADIGDTWTVDVDSVRYMDAQGAIISEDPSLNTRTFSFQSFATANDVELKLTEASDNPDAQVVMADDNSVTEGVVLVSGNLKAVGSDVDIKGVQASVTKTGTGDIGEIASQFTLKIDGEEVDSLDASEATTTLGGSTACTTGSTCYLDFDDVDVTVKEGDTVKIQILVDVNEVDGTTVAEGDSLAASLDADNIDAEDESGEDLGSGDLTGAITGDAQTFITEGISVTPGAMTATAQAVDGAADYAQYTLKVSVTAIDQDVYLDKSFVETSSQSLTPIGSNRVDVVNASGTQLTSGFSASISSTDNDAEELTYTYRIREGATADFTITVNATGTSAQQRAILYGLEWGSSDAATLSNVYISNMGLNGDYKTNLVYVSGV